MTEACRIGLACWFDQNEGLGVWAGSVASAFVAAVALGLPFLLRWLDKADKRQRVAWNSVLAIHHARGALLLIMELQRELFGQVQTPLNKTNRQWDFELGVAEDAVAWALKSEIDDPALLPHLSAAHAWTRMARNVLTLSAQDGLFQMQYSTQAREAAAASLLRMQEHFLQSATRLVLKPKPPRAGVAEAAAQSGG